MRRFEILNHLIRKFNYTSYLEVGVQKNASFKTVECARKVGVDPDPSANATFCMESDKFFAQNKESFDIFFVDGLHEYEQVYRDILNSLKYLKEGGTIVCHDMNPSSYEAQEVPRVQRRWNGDVWKAFVRLRTERDDLEMFTVDTDEGCAIIRKGKQKKLEGNIILDYRFLDQNRKSWLNLISVNEFLEKYKIASDYDVYEFVPYSISKNYGDACNKCFELVPNDNDWIIIRDTDALTLTPSHIHMIRRAIDMHPYTGMFTGVTNRVGQKRQVYDMKLFENLDAKVHRKIALELANKPLTFTEFDIPISGYMMIMKKSTWKEVGGFKDGILGVDTNISNKLRKENKKILMINNLYIYHYYRGLEGIGWKDHIK